MMIFEVVLIIFMGLIMIRERRNARAPPDVVARSGTARPARINRTQTLPSLEDMIARIASRFDVPTVRSASVGYDLTVRAGDGAPQEVNLGEAVSETVGR